MKGSSCNNCQIILQKSPINKTGENLRIAEDDSQSEEDISDEIDDDDGRKLFWNKVYSVL